MATQQRDRLGYVETTGVFPPGDVSDVTAKCTLLQFMLYDMLYSLRQNMSADGTLLASWPSWNIYNVPSPRTSGIRPQHREDKGKSACSAKKKKTAWNYYLLYIE